MLPSYLECIPCIFNQLIDIVHFNELDDEQGMRIMHSAMDRMRDYDLLKGSAPEITALIHKDIREQIANNDLYYQAKRDSNKLASSLIERVENLVSEYKDPLKGYVKMAIAGNVMDYGARVRFDIEETVENILHSDFGVDHYQELAFDLKKERRTILYIGDNAGEIVFDKLFIQYLIEKYDHQITFLVKSEPILNDVLLEDAKEVGIDQVVPVMESGSTTPGTLYKEMKPEIKELYHSVDLVISKGQGNYETLPRDLTKTYFLLKMKCSKIAEVMGINLGDLLVHQVGNLK